MSSCIAIQYEPGGACSGFPCINTTSPAFCLCEFPFVNVGDFAPELNVDCGIHFIAVKALYGLLIFVNVLLFIPTLYVMYQRRNLMFKSFRGLRRPENLLILTNFFAPPFLIAASALEISASFPGERSVGIDPATTTLFSIGTTIVWTDFKIYNRMVANLQVKQLQIFGKPEGNRLVQFYLRLFVFEVIIIAVNCVLLIVVPFRTGITQYQMIQAYYVLQVVLILGAMLMMVASFRFVIRDLRLAAETHKNEVLKGTLNQFENLNLNIWVQTTSQSILFLLFAFMPILTRKSAYFLPATWTIALTLNLSYTKDLILKPRTDSSLKTMTNNRGITSSMNNFEYKSDNEKFSSS